MSDPIPTPDLRALLAAAERAIAAKQELERLAPPPSIDVLLTRRDLVDARRELFDAVWAFDELVMDPTSIAAIVRELMARREHDIKPCGDAVAHANDARPT